MTRFIHPRVVAAAEGTLPEWTAAGDERRAHADRVAALMAEWSGELGLSEADRIRWVAAGRLHDTLKDADPSELRPHVPRDLLPLPDGLLHGPAAAERLRSEGVADEDLLRAIAFHTLGHPELDVLGQALYAADFLEPGRRSRASWRAELRERMPHEMAEVVLQVTRARIMDTLNRKRVLRPETARFWSRLVSSCSVSSAGPGDHA